MYECICHYEREVKNHYHHCLSYLTFPYLLPFGDVIIVYHLLSSSTHHHHHPSGIRQRLQLLQPQELTEVSR